MPKAELELNCFPSATSLIVGQRIMVRSVIRNIGQSDAMVSDDPRGSELFYEIRLREDAEQVADYCPFDDWLERHPEETHAPPVQRILPAGATRAHTEEVRHFGLEAGDYAMCGVYLENDQYFASPSATLTVQPANPHAFLTDYCVNTHRFWSIFTHHNQGSAEIFIQQTLSDDPRDGGFVRCLQRDGAPIETVAFGQPSYASPHGRWVAWIQGQHFGAGFFANGKFQSPIASLDLGADGCQLLPRGNQIDDDHGLFFVTDMPGRRLLRISCDSEGAHGLVYPSPWSAEGLHTQPMPFGWAHAAPTHLIWQEVLNGDTSILSQALPDGGPQTGDSPACLHRSSQRLLAWSLPSCAEGSGSRLATLVRDEPDGTLVYQEVPLSEMGPPLSSITLTAPEGDVASWQIIGACSGTPFIVARSNTGLWLCDVLSDNSWDAISHDLQGALTTTAMDKEGQIWLNTFDSNRGIASLLLHTATPVNTGQSFEDDEDDEDDEDQGGEWVEALSDDEELELELNALCALAKAEEPDNNGDDVPNQETV